MLNRHWQETQKQNESKGKESRQNNQAQKLKKEEEKSSENQNIALGHCFCGLSIYGRLTAFCSSATNPVAHLLSLCVFRGDSKLQLLPNSTHGKDFLCGLA